MSKRKMIPLVLSGLILSSTSFASSHQVDCFQKTKYTQPNRQQLYDSARRGDPTAQTELGRMYHLGLGVPSNPSHAVIWYKKAASQGDAEAQFNLGVMYLDGIGVTENSNEALRWISRAAKQKHGTATQVYNYILNNDGPLEC